MDSHVCPSSAQAAGRWNSFVSVAFGSDDTISGLLLISLVYISNFVVFFRTFLQSRVSLQKPTKQGGAKDKARR